MIARFALVAAMVAALLSVAGPSSLAAEDGPAGAPARAKPRTHTVTIDGTRFQPDTLTIARGDTVMWVNKDPFPHTATSKAGGFDSQPIPRARTGSAPSERRGISLTSARCTRR